MIVVYFHGYGSSANSDKVTELKKHFSEVYSTNIPLDFDEAQKHLIDEIYKLLYSGRQLLFVGTSLGGYWATRMSNYFKVPAVIINPSCSPRTTLQRYGVPSSTFEKYVDLECTVGVPRTVLLTKDDDVLDYKVAHSLFTGIACVKLFESGGHRFNQINTIVENINELHNGSWYLP